MLQSEDCFRGVILNCTKNSIQGEFSHPTTFLYSLIGGGDSITKENTRIVMCSALCMILGVSLHHCCRCLVLAPLVCTLTFDPRHPSLSEQRELLWREHMFLCGWLQWTLL